MQKILILCIIIFSFFSKLNSQGFQWGLKGGFGFSNYGIDKNEFTDPKGNPYSVEGTGSVVSIQLGVSSIVNMNNSIFYFGPEFYYVKGGGKLEFTDLSIGMNGGEKSTITQTDHLFELAAPIGIKLGLFNIFTGPTFSYRISTNGAASDYLDNIFNNGLGETNDQSLYMGIVAGLGYSIDKNSIINIRYSFPILGNELTIENNSYSNNMAFSLIGVDLIYIFEQ